MDHIPYIEVSDIGMWPEHACSLQWDVYVAWRVGRSDLGRPNGEKTIAAKHLLPRTLQSR